MSAYFIKKTFCSKAILFSVLVATLSLIIFSSCKSTQSKKQVSDMPKFTSTKMPITRSLFMQSKGPNIELPRRDGIDFDSINGGSIVAEVVTFKEKAVDNQGKEVVYKEGENKLDTSAVYRLAEVEIKAKSQFAAERDGRVNVSFNVTVPKEVLSSDWRVIMTPKILHNDSVIPLQKIVLTGKGFADKQKEDYDRYEAYIKTLIDKSQYDSVYLDKANIAKDILERRELYFVTYQKEWKRQMDFKNWLLKKEYDDANKLATEIGKNDEMYHEYARKAMKKSYTEMVQGNDTTGFYDQYMEKYELKRLQHSSKQVGQDVNINSIPKEFRDLYESERNVDDIDNFIFTEKDSINIAEHRYFFDQIAFNEVAIARKDETFNSMVPFPYFEDKNEFRLDTIAEIGKDFMFYYEQDYPVTPGLKSVRIAMESRVKATDESGYNLPKADTLSYFISSLSQLIDTAFVYKKTMLHRNLYDKKTLNLKYKGAAGFTYEDSYATNKAEMAKFLEAFRTYNDNVDYTIDSISIHTTTALDGDYQKNTDLSIKRAKSLMDYFLKTLSKEADVNNMFRTNARGEDWSGLVAELKKRNDIQNKDAILNMLANAVYPDQTEEEIATMYQGDFAIIKDSIYPILRKTNIIIDMHRTGLETDSLDVEYRSDYEEGLRLLEAREYWKAIEILGNYPDYNAALCLLCMGYNEKAGEVLARLKQTPGTEYLYAILKVRQGKDDEAVQHLFTACEADPSKVYRTVLDPDINGLVKKYNLQSRLDALK